MSFRPNGLVTLLTDFGTRDTYVGQMKGVLHGRAPGLRGVVDLTHEIPPQNVALAGFLLEHAARVFPAGTIHVAVVDPGVGSARDILLARMGDQAVVAPDNGLLAPWLERGPEPVEIHALDPARIDRPAGSRTFHGRDLFVPAAAAWLGGTEPGDLGAPRSPGELVSGMGSGTARAVDGGFEARILFADHFGNLVTDLAAERLGPDPGRFALHHGERALPIRGTYAEVREGEPLALINSFDLVELAVRNGNALESTGLSPGDRLRILPVPPPVGGSGRP